VEQWLFGVNHWLFGVETEYAFTAFNGQGTRIFNAEALPALLELARRKVPNLPGRRKGLFLQNGSRFYLDYGNHPELCTPECTTPVELVRYLLAGERVLADLARDMVEEVGSNIKTGVSGATFYKCNVDYSGTGSTWGSHESYLHRANPRWLPAQLLPHLVTRLIYTGAGGFDNTHPGIRFVISPRAPHMHCDVSSESTCCRGIFHTRNEPLTRGQFNRLHLLCGESLCSQRAMGLRVGTTALVLSLVERGFRPGSRNVLKSPVQAMRAFAADPRCEVEAPLEAGGTTTAEAVQRHYLECVEANLDQRFTPPWAVAVCREWRTVLDHLKQSPEALDRVLDWRIKAQVFSDHVRRRGMSWEKVQHWNPVLEKLQAAARSKDVPVVSKPRPLLDLVRSRRGPLAVAVKQLTPELAAHGLDWNGLEPFLNLRQELFEIDTRFGQVGPDGIFAGLDRAGVLTHHLEGVEAIEEAVESPPATTRAGLRGKLVRELSGKSSKAGKTLCDWNGVWNLDRREVLDLGDPFTRDARWKKLPQIRSRELEEIIFEEGLEGLEGLEDYQDFGDHEESDEDLSGDTPF